MKKTSKKCTFKFQECLTDLSVKNYWQISSDKKTFFSDFLVKYMSTYSYILKVSWIQNEFMRSSFLPKCKPKITRISALPNKQES